MEQRVSMLSTARTIMIDIANCHPAIEISRLRTMSIHDLSAETVGFRQRVLLCSDETH